MSNDRVTSIDTDDDDIDEAFALLKAFVEHGGCEYDSEWDEPDQQGVAIASAARRLLTRFNISFDYNGPNE